MLTLSRMLIEFSWQPPYVGQATHYGNNVWIHQLKWRRNDNNDLMPKRVGLYVIENPSGTPVYAGRAVNWRERFDGRSAALNELDIMPNVVVATHRVYLASIKVTPRASDGLSWAEQWLVRNLSLHDRATNNPQRLQNIHLTSPYLSPEGGLTIQHKQQNKPAYLNDQRIRKNTQV